jgi:hypothetical protein
VMKSALGAAGALRKVHRWMLSGVLVLGMSAVVAPASAQQCSASASANAGDSVTVLSILHTIDPNENGEGEPLGLSVSNGGPSTSFPDYEVTHSFTFKAQSTAPVTAVGTNIGFDGDESCEVSISVNGKHRFSQTQKNVLIAVTGGFGTLSGLSWTLSEACALGIVTAYCTPFAGLTAALSTTIAAASGTLLAIDPIDLNYTVIPTPIPAPFTPLTAGNGLTQAGADSMNAVLSTEASIVGVLRAIVTSVNRAAGADSVGATVWEQKQQNAINGFMFRLGTLLTQEAAARQSFVAQLTSENSPLVSITPSEVFNFEAQLAFQGWSADQLALLKGVGDEDNFIQAAKPLIFTQDINQVAGDLPAAFASPAFLAILRQAGHDLTPFAGVPGNANCHGTTVAALATQYGSIDSAAASLGFNAVKDLQNAVRTFCGN